MNVANISHNIISIGRQVFSHFQERKASSCVVVAWEDKCHNHECYPWCCEKQKSPRLCVSTTQQ